ncbi:type II toxin-antitoxin system VapC family toxin [Desulfatitalea alkaliphila]|uniref:Type II toxin-antitoxin system VapC family toxin n=1 Tax=Desulfatitalea alkaliphila TaxID=2929485 RepID=A0AA41UNB5_9BACT|nr:type II toxin-antitoxin system VapC family toxin [Desulfatitalea alkaliphila]MCJ8499363.1 type II toxin-antitoxin system VapC family toxin [Desulfatitalea alkaliphila]
MAKIDSYVLDSYALIGYLEDEPFADWLQALLRSADRGECRLYLHAIQLGEVYYITLREQGRATADLAYSRIKAFPVILDDTIDEKLLLTAASLKARFPISYADAFAAALSQQHHAQLVTGDPEFKPLQTQGHIQVHWL